jgi:hypothetical protein
MLRGRSAIGLFDLCAGAFSGEVGTGSPQKMRSSKEFYPAFHAAFLGEILRETPHLAVFASHPRRPRH